jgi:hypothetical protein
MSSFVTLLSDAAVPDRAGPSVISIENLRTQGRGETRPCVLAGRAESESIAAGTSGAERLVEIT